MSTEDKPQEAEKPDVSEHPFQAEVQKVLTLVIDSLYTNKDVFLRELVSNASDALDKGRFFGMTHEDAIRPEGEARIDIKTDEAARTLTITDNGIGMTRDEVVQNLGTIAKSGSLEFLKQMRDAQKDKDDPMKLIGQFGVGFYAAFMVAKRVDVSTHSMAHGATPVIWRSTGSDTFTVLPGDRKEPGTDIVLHLKEDQSDYLRSWRLKEIIQKYSDFVSFPIFIDGEQVNRSKALWAQPRGQVTEEQHSQFFQHLSGGSSGDHPLLTIHFAIDAPAQFQALLYVPEKAPFDLFQKERTALRLYAKRVLIIESCERLTPIWLRFLRGVVDSEDLSLNVSREMLQEDKTLAQIERELVRQVLKSLKDLSESDPEKYKKFWRTFGKVLKEGVSVDWKNKDAILELSRFESMNTPEGDYTSLKAYVAAMPESQSEIYYVTGMHRRAVEASPHIEAFKKKGYDVLFLTDPIDEWVVQSTPEYEKKKLKSVVHGDVDLGDEAPKEGAPSALEAIKKALGGRVKDVRFSKRLTDSASCLVSEEGAPGANMERIMRMLDERATEQKRILEVNPAHPVVESIATLAEKEPGSARLTSFCEMLYEQALLAEGVVEDPTRLVRKIQDLLAQAAGAAAKS
jgi:molecular chaperone HtpG